MLRTKAGRVLTLRLSEDARLRIAVQRPRRGRWTNVRVVTRAARPRARPASRSGACACPAATASLISATDDAGNDSARRLVRFRIRG